MPEIFFVKNCLQNHTVINFIYKRTELPVGIVDTDGHLSYPATTTNLVLYHDVVNHTEGFCESDETHTKNIERFWAHMKSSMRKEHGVKRSSIDEWPIQYTLKRRYLMNKKREIFLKLISVYCDYFLFK